MKMESIRFRVLVSSFLIFFLSSCNNSGFELQKFEVSNKGLDSVINTISKGYCLSCKENMKKIVVLDFTMDKDSIQEFWFSFHEKDELRDFYIFHLNQRIIGYTVKNNVKIILLSNIDRKDVFEDRFGRFIYPTDEKRKFNFLYFPNNQYKLKEEINTINGHSTTNKWPDIYGIHDYVYIHLKYINDRFLVVNESD